MRAEDINSLESESGVIATLFHHPDFYFYSEHLLPNHFTDKENQCVYTAIAGLVKNGIFTIDSYNIIEFLNSSEATRKFADELSIDKLNELMDMSDVLARHTVEEYKMLVSNVTDAAFRRDLFIALRECAGLCARREEQGIEKKVYSAIDEVMIDYSAADEVPEFKDMVDDLWQEIIDHQDGKDAGIPFKFPTLNEFVRIEQGELVVVGAPAKGAKSMFMLNEAIDILRQGKSVFYLDIVSLPGLILQNLARESSFTSILREDITPSNLKTSRERSSERASPNMIWSPVIHITIPRPVSTQIFNYTVSN